MVANKYEIVMGLEPYIGDGQVIEAEATPVIAVTPKLPDYSVEILLKRLAGALGGIEVEEREVSHEFILDQSDIEKPKFDPDRALRFTRKLIRQSVRPEELEDVIILTSQPVILQNDTRPTLLEVHHRERS